MNCPTCGKPGTTVRYTNRPKKAPGTVRRGRLCHWCGQLFQTEEVVRRVWAEAEIPAGAIGAAP